MLKLQVKMEEKRQERPPEKPVYYKLCWRLSNVWLVDTFCRDTMTSINTSFKNLVRIWWNNDRKLAQHSALNTRQTTASLHIGGHVSRNQCTRRFMSGVCFHQIVLMFVCSLVTLNRLMRLKNTQHEENVHRVLLRASVFSLLGSASPLASLWHKSARLTHCLRWSQAEDMAAPTPRCPTFPLAHIHQQQTTKPPPPPSHSRDSHYFTLSAEGLQGSHRISFWRLASCHHLQSRGRVGAHPRSAWLSTAQHGSTYNTNQSLVLIIYDIFFMIINSWELYYIPDVVQTPSHLRRLWSPAGPIGLSHAHSISPLPPPPFCFSTSLIGVCLCVLWSVATAWSVLLPPKV